MEELAATLGPAPELVTCENCRATHSPDKKFCSECSFPIQGTEQEKTSFRLILGSRKRLLRDAQEKVTSAKQMIYVAAGIFFVAGLIVYGISDDLGVLVVNLVVCLLYLILAAWSSKNAFGAILTAFVVYITLQVVNAFVDPATIFSGIIIKVILIAAFVKGIRSAIDAKNLMKELEKLKGVPDGYDK